jgi:hypothetical protein
VFISYGAQTNGSLFKYYGFTEQGNPNEVYSLTAAINGQQVKVRTLWHAASISGVCMLHLLPGRQTLATV